MILAIVVGTQSVAVFGYPDTVWKDKTFTVTGRVFHVNSWTTGISGAYVAIVNGSNPTQEYAHTTSAEDGSYSFSGVIATYSSIQGTGPNGKPDSYAQAQNMYKIMAKKGQFGPACSAGFGVDYDSAKPLTTTLMLYTDQPIPSTVLYPSGTPVPTPSRNPYASTPTSMPNMTPGPTLGQQTTPIPRASLTPSREPGATGTTVAAQASAIAETPMPEPADSGMSWTPAIIALVIVGIMALAAIIFIALKFR